MQITILPYIDSTPAETAAVNDSDTVQASTVSTAAGSDADFSATLQAAERAIAAITVDFIASQDEDKIKEAAAILSSSKVPQLQDIGKALLNTETNTDTGSTAVNAVTPSGTDPSVSAASSVDTASAPATGTSSSMELASASVSPDASDVSSKLGCPDELQAYFCEAAEKYDVDVALLESIAKAESNFTPSAKSSAGAIGIMQLMPATAKGLGVKDSYDAYENIMGGAKLISSLLDKYDGDTSLALAAYNAGSGNVEKYGGIPPFKETQNYVVKVLGYYKDATA